MILYFTVLYIYDLSLSLSISISIYDLSLSLSIYDLSLYLYIYYLCLSLSLYIGNTVGRNNYKYFVSLLFTHAVGAVLWTILAITLTFRMKTSWFFIFYIVYSLMWFCLILGLGSYHLQLICTNITTNEHINYHRYTHMRDSRGYG